MNDPEELEPTQEIEGIVRSAFQIQDPDQLFIDRLEKKLADRFKDIERSNQDRNTLSGRSQWLDKFKLLLTPLAWGAIATILILFLAWGIKTLIPKVEPSISGQSTPSPSIVSTTVPTQAEGGKATINLPVSAGMPVPW